MWCKNDFHLPTWRVTLLSTRADQLWPSLAQNPWVQVPRRVQPAAPPLITSQSTVIHSHKTACASSSNTQVDPLMQTSDMSQETAVKLELKRSLSKVPGCLGGWWGSCNNIFQRSFKSGLVVECGLICVVLNSEWAGSFGCVKDNLFRDLIRRLILTYNVWQYFPHFR